MKKTMAFLLLTGCIWAEAQNQVSDYQYIYVPQSFEKSLNSYKLEDLLASDLEAKGYKILREDMANWPMELKQAPCQVLNANLENDSSFLRNRVKLVFSNCQKTELASIKGSSFYKEYDKGFRDALQKTMQEVPQSEPTGTLTNQVSTVASVLTPAKPAETMPEKKAEPQKEVKPTEEPKIVERNTKSPKITGATIGAVSESGKEETQNIAQKSNPVKEEPAPSTPSKAVVAETPATGGAEVYLAGTKKLNRVNLGADEFILVDPNSTAPFASFKQTRKAGVYHVKLQDGKTAVGYIENDGITLEIPNGNDFTTETLKKQ